jgi:hypothetical protein
MVGCGYICNSAFSPVFELFLEGIVVMFGKYFSLFGYVKNCCIEKFSMIHFMVAMKRIFL